MEFFLETLEGTPWYVYVIFLYVIFVGFRAMRPRKIAFRKVLIIPVLLALWSITGLYDRWDHSFLSIALWIVALGAGTSIGWSMTRPSQFHVDRNKSTITIEGNRWMIWLVLAFFVIRYCFGYYYATTPFIPPRSVCLDFAVSGALVGVFVGRAVRYCYVYFR
jgi:hypothetical protein